MSKSEDKRKAIQANDIVTRLRVPVQHTLVFGNIEQVNDERHEAADEIERLRTAITDFIIKTSDSHCTWQMENDAIEELKKVVRGE